MANSLNRRPNPQKLYSMHEGNESTVWREGERNVIDDEITRRTEKNLRDDNEDDGSIAYHIYPPHETRRWCSSPPVGIKPRRRRGAAKPWWWCLFNVMLILFLWWWIRLASFLYVIHQGCNNFTDRTRKILAPSWEELERENENNLAEKNLLAGLTLPTSESRALTASSIL